MTFNTTFTEEVLFLHWVYVYNVRNGKCACFNCMKYWTFGVTVHYIRLKKQFGHMIY